MANIRRTGVRRKEGGEVQVEIFSFRGNFYADIVSRGFASDEKGAVRQALKLADEGARKELKSRELFKQRKSTKRGGSDGGGTQKVSAQKNKRSRTHR